MTTTWDLVSARLPGLKRLGTNARGEDEYASNNPLHAGSDSMGFKVAVDPLTGEKGAFRNHAAHAGEPESGSLYDLAELLGIEPVGQKKAEPPKRKAFASLAEYAAAHHVTEQTFLDAGWEFLPADHKQNYHKRPLLRWKVNGRYHFRFLDSEKPKFLWEKLRDANGNPVSKAGDGWYGLKRAAIRAGDFGYPLILVNGEASVVVGQAYGLPVAAWAGGEEHFNESAIAELKEAWNGEVLVALDADEAGRKGAKRVMKHLREAGFTCYRVDLKMEEHGDVADVCGLHGEKALTTLFSWVVRDESAVPEPPDPPEPPPDLTRLMAELRKLTRKELEESAIYEQMRRLVDDNDRKQASGKIVPFSASASRGRQKARDAAANPQESVGFKTYIPAFDEINGGFKPFFYGFLAATNMGKTQWMTTVAAALLRQAPGLIVPTESSVEDWMRRLVAADTGVSAERIELGKLSPEELAKVDASFARYEGMDVAFLEDVAPTPAMVRAAFAEGHKAHGWEWVIVDSATNMSDAADDLFQKSSAIAEGLLDIYKEFDVPVLASFQDNRETSGRGKKGLEPRMRDIFGGSKNEQLINVLWGIYDHDYYVQQGMASEDLTKYPQGTVSLIALKLKRTPPNNQRRCFVRRIPGAGFAATEVRRVSVDTRELSMMKAREKARKSSEDRDDA